MNTDTALNLLGPLASQAVQRRYIVGGTKDSYLLAKEVLNDGDYFLRHPELGANQSLHSIQEFARALRECAREVPLDDVTVSNETLVERDPYWARIRNAAKVVLQEMGADLEAWERDELEAGAGVADKRRISPEIADPRLIVAALTAVRNRPPPKDPSSLGCIGAIIAAVAIALLPLVARWTAWSSTALWGIGVALGVAVVGGSLLGIFGGGFGRGAVAGDAEEAIDQLVAAYPYGDPAIMRQAAVLILDQSTVSTGPTTVGTFERAEVAVRLGNALSYVLQVERILLERNEIYPCFTLLDPSFSDRDGGWQWMDDEP
ncbi:MAG: hypothetical protein IH876_15315 [Gemmatimonadetes bacterium]|nr:hypothetical protein [Gemmatimonadota bacterium]